MSQSVKLVEKADTPEQWTTHAADGVDNGDITSGRVLVHDSGAHIAIDETFTAVRIYLPSGLIYRFEPQLCEPVPAVERLAERYDVAVTVDNSTSGEESWYTYYAVVNEYAHEPIPFCREGEDEAVYDELKQAVVVAEQMRHKYGNQEIRVVQLDRTEIEALQD
jgi:hypothetical protein